MNDSNQDIIFYDGLCALCNGFVRFVLKRDHDAYFVFASLQAAMKAGVVQQENLPDSIVLQTHQKEILVKSGAVIGVLRHLSVPWPVLGILLQAIPKFLRDGFYDFMAPRRRKLFGSYEQCPLPQAQWKDRFINLDSMPKG